MKRKIIRVAMSTVMDDAKFAVVIKRWQERGYELVNLYHRDGSPRLVFLPIAQEPEGES